MIGEFGETVVLEWGLAKIKVLLFTTNTSSPITTVVFSPQSNIVATGLQNGLIKIYNLSPFSLIKIIKDFSTPVGAICFSSGGKYLAASAGTRYSGNNPCSVCSIRIYSAQGFELLSQLNGHTSDILKVDLLNKKIITVSADGRIIIYDAIELIKYIESLKKDDMAYFSERYKRMLKNLNPAEILDR